MARYWPPRPPATATFLIDGTLIETDRVATPGPTPGVDLWWSGKHHNHGGNVQVISAPDGRPLWTSDVRAGREHDTTAVRMHREVLPALADITEDLRTLGDLGYEGESDTTFQALRNVSLDPWRIGAIVAAALVLLHFDHDRTT